MAGSPIVSLGGQISVLATSFAPLLVPRGAPVVKPFHPSDVLVPAGDLSPHRPDCSTCVWIRYSRKEKESVEAEDDFERAQCRYKQTVDDLRVRMQAIKENEALLLRHLREVTGPYATPPFSRAPTEETDILPSQASALVSSLSASPGSLDNSGPSQPHMLPDGEDRLRTDTGPALAIDPANTTAHTPEYTESGGHQLRPRKQKNTDGTGLPTDPVPPSGSAQGAARAQYAPGECPRGSHRATVRAPVNREAATVDSDTTGAGVSGGGHDANTSVEEPEPPAAKKQRVDAVPSRLPEYAITTVPAAAPSRYREAARLFLRKLAEKLPNTDVERARAFTMLLSMVNENHGRDYHLPPRQKSVSDLVARINTGHQNQAIFKWISMLDKICLASIIDGICERDCCYLSDACDAIRAKGCPGLPDDNHTFRVWLQQGRKYAMLAAAGSIFIPLAIAQFDMIKAVTDASTPMLHDLGNTLRDPDSDPSMASVVATTIIPWVQYCQARLHFTMDGIFDKTLCEKGSLGQTIDTWNLIQSDKFFDSFAKRDFILLAREVDYWKACTAAVPNVPCDKVVVSTSGVLVLTCVAREPPQAPPKATTDRMILDTKFDFDARANKAIPYPTQTAYEREKWTNAECKRALRAVEPEDWTSLKAVLEAHYSSKGVKRPSAYVALGQKLIAGKRTRLNSSDGRLLALILGDLPEDIRSALSSNLQAVLQAHGLVPEHSLQHKSKGEAKKYPAFHFQYYARNPIRGDNAPHSIHPLYLVRTDASGTNYTQMGVYPSNDVTKHSELYRDLCEVFAKLFAWIEVQIKEQLPEFKDDLEFAVEALPGTDCTPVYPFTGFVVNLNVRTLAHRDVKDLDLCLVIPLGDFTGGELCLVEPGLVFHLRSGDVLAFNSKDIAHFNLEYEGIRASLVFSTDVHISTFRKTGHNGWETNKHYRK